MNPSYNSGGPNVPGVKPGTIASGPDNGTSGGVVSGGVAPVQPQPNRYIPPRQTSFTPPVIQIGDSPKRLKKGIIIGAILIVVALVLGILAVVMMPKGGNDSGENADFYKYANYLLYGNQNTNADLGEYDEKADYAATEAFDSNNVDYFAVAQELWSVFYQKVADNEEIAETSALRGSVNWQNELMDFMNKYINTKKLEEEDIMELYLKNGYEEVMNLINERYTDLNTVVYIAGLDYVKSLTSWSKATVDLYASYDSNGCLVDGDVDDACAEENADKMQDVYDRYVIATNDLYINDIDIYEVLQMLELNCFNIEEHLENSEAER